jgi:hypothetical protein
MLALLHLIGILVVNFFKSRSRLEAENLFLRHQLNIALRRAPSRIRLSGYDRVLLVLMTRVWPGLLSVAQVAPSCGGIVPGSGSTGAGSPETGRAGPRSTGNCAISSDE